ncbi:MAG: BrnT family toxin [Gallionella sp.]
MITYDEVKRQRNIREHGLDFVGCEVVFDSPVLTEEDSRLHYQEHRINLLGFLNGFIVHLTYTEREDSLHVISLRKATSHEIRYFAQKLSK